jgi:hypothetical protein
MEKNTLQTVFEKINNVNKSLESPISKKGRKHKISCEEEKRFITLNPMNIERIIGIMFFSFMQIH